MNSKTISNEFNSKISEISTRFKYQYLRMNHWLVKIGDKMKLVKTASGKKLKLSKSEWQSIGRKAGWMKIAMDDSTPCKCRECGKKSKLGDCSSETGVFKGCPSCGSKNVEKNVKD